MLKKFFALICIAGSLAACSKNEPEDSDTGSIYGIITVKSTAEPMRATGVELYKGETLLLKTVTYDDGHYEFDNLEARKYTLKVTAEGYQDISYDVRVEAGRTARADMQLEKIDTRMTVRTLDITNIGGDRVTFRGTHNYSGSIKDCGFIYGKTAFLTDGVKISADVKTNFSYTLTGLKRGKYYVKAYAVNSYGTEFGETISFEISGSPTVSTLDATNVTDNTATLNGLIEYAGDPAYTERGFVYSASFSNPTVDDPASATTKVVVPGTSQEFSANVAGLTENAQYYVRAYAKNSDGTVYGTSKSFIATSYVPYIIIDAIAVQRTDLSTGTTWSAAINLCDQSRVGGFSDWHVPTLSELTLLYTNKTTIGGFSAAEYWSSTIYSSYYGQYYDINFTNGNTGYRYNSNTCRVRCVRTLK